MEIPALDLKTGKPTGKNIYINGLNSNLKVTIGFVKPVTIAFIHVDGMPGIGIAKCMESDKWSDDVGAGIAISRALGNIAFQLQETWLNRSITKDEWEKKHGKK